MYIFIDESGLFIPNSKVQAWSSVGALVIPEVSLAEAEHALRCLKVSHKVDLGCEFEKDSRPDCSSRHFRKFLDRLVRLGCSLQVVSTRGAVDGSVGVQAHRESLRKGMGRYVEIAPHASAAATEVLSLMDALSDQQYNQSILQSYMICDLIPKVLSFYSLSHSHELGSFKWVVDAKDKFEIKYETFFKSVYSELFSASLIHTPIGPQHDGKRSYDAFYQSFSAQVSEEVVVSNVKKIFGKDLSPMLESMKAIDFSGVLRRDFKLEDSAKSLGLQMADLVVTGVNRCLKQNYSDNEGMAKAFGQLMINAPYHEEQALRVMGHSGAGAIEGSAGGLLDLMDASARQLFGLRYRAAMSERRAEHWRISAA